MLVLAGRPAFTRLCEGVHMSTSFMSSSLLVQQCPTCLVRLTWVVFVMGVSGRTAAALGECCLQDMFNIAHSFLM